MDAPLQFSRLYKDRRWAPCIEAPILIRKTHVPLHEGLDGPDGSPAPRAGATPQQLGIEAAMEPTGVLHGSFYGAPPVFAVVGVAIASAFVFGPAVAQALDKGRRKRNCEGTRSPNRCMVVAAEHLSGGPEGTIAGFPSGIIRSNCKGTQNISMSPAQRLHTGRSVLHEFVQGGLTGGPTHGFQSETF